MASTPIKVMTSLATKEFLVEYLAQYQNTSGQAVAYENAGGVEIAKRARAGESFDVVVLASGVIDALIAEGKLAAGSKVDVVKSSAAIAVPAGAVRPDIGTEEALKRAILAAPSVCYSTGPSGVYLERLFAQWGIAEAIKAKLKVAPPGVPVASMLASGKAALGFQQLTELIHMAGIEVIGPLPPAIQLITTFSAGISTTCGQVEAAQKLLAGMASVDAAPAKRKHGLEPA
jgi:molybdate transport system substrate-binding protein